MQHQHIIIVMIRDRGNWTDERRGGREGGGVQNNKMQHQYIIIVMIGDRGELARRAQRGEGAQKK